MRTLETKQKAFQDLAIALAAVEAAGELSDLPRLEL
jgi:hypothetical protein